MNIQEKCIQLESKSLQIASKIKELNYQFDEESERRRLLEQERKKEIKNLTEDLRGDMEGLEDNINKLM